MTTDPTRAEVERLIERSKDDGALIVGSEVRVVARALLAAWDRARRAD